MGCTGVPSAALRVLEGLKRLEYRGYDSAGIAWFDGTNALKWEKSAGRINALAERLSLRRDLGGSTAIGHTRWATHGAPTDENSHPHGNGRVQLVHNGIIENYAALRRELSALGYRFTSDTDTEAAALLLDHLARQTKSRAEAMRELARRLAGSFAIGAIFSDEPEAVYAIRRDSPLLIALGEGENYLASDMTAVLAYTRRYLSLEAGELAILSANGVILTDGDGNRIEREVQRASWDASAAERGGHAHFMHKEIFEGAQAIRDTLGGGIFDAGETGVLTARLAECDQIRFVACGTAYHAALLGARAIERFAGIPVSVELASEFRYRDPLLSPKSAVILVSQSGETADTLAALRLARSLGVYTVGVVNTVGSAIAREADAVLYTHAGPEIAVASTKAYTVQSALLTALALMLAMRRGTLSESELRIEREALEEALPEAIGEILEREGEICRIARAIASSEHLFFIGRCADHDAAAEASLKLKEISYIHSEAYAAGELKHGTISLIEGGTPVVAISTETALREKLLGNMRETKARGAHVLLFGTKGAEPLAEEASECFLIPALSASAAPIALATALQLLAYHVAVLRGCDVDRPRNLAKSVTVE